MPRSTISLQDCILPFFEQPSCVSNFGLSKAEAQLVLTCQAATKMICDDFVSPCQARAQTVLSVFISITLSAQKLVGLLKWFVGTWAVPSNISDLRLSRNVVSPSFFLICSLVGGPHSKPIQPRVSRGLKPSGKVAERPPETCNGMCRSGLFVVVLLCGLAFLLWVATKVAFVFICPSHLWNLTTGCVDVA